MEINVRDLTFPISEVSSVSSVFIESNELFEVLNSGKKVRYKACFSYKLSILEEISLSLSAAVISISLIVMYFLFSGREAVDSSWIIS